MNNGMRWGVTVGLFITAISVLSAIAQLSGIHGSLLLGAVVIVASILALGVMTLVASLRRRGPDHVHLEDVLRRELPNAEYVDCLFSAGDRLRQVFHTVLEDDRMDRIKKGLVVRVIVRARDSDSMLRVDENLERMRSMLSKAGIGFESKAVAWEHCMVEGTVFDDNNALVGFYYREDSLTYAVSNLLLRVDRSRSDADRILYLALRRTFDALWNSEDGQYP